MRKKSIFTRGRRPPLALLRKRLSRDLRVPPHRLHAAKKSKTLKPSLQPRIKPSDRPHNQILDVRRFVEM
ncbi:MAG TPA: hypothetical protein VN689_04360, partial [Burkholderiales bacterium]|nr:hypothetical protein [Burkholderiales bacterium]